MGKCALQAYKVHSTEISDSLLACKVFFNRKMIRFRIDESENSYLQVVKLEAIL